MTRHRKVTRRNRSPQAYAQRFSVEELEPRTATGTLWSPFTLIDIQGIAIAPTDGFDGHLIVAGTELAFSIIGSGLDFDLKMLPQSGTWVPVEDSVNITWCLGNDNSLTQSGNSASFHIGSAGTAGIYDVVMYADDGGSVPAGDFGSRNDPALHFTTSFTAIWVNITGNFNGPLDYDAYGYLDQLEFHSEVVVPDNEAGYTTPATPGSIGWFTKTELIGTVYPLGAAVNAPGFTWQQQVENVKCMQKFDGTWDYSYLYKSDYNPYDSNQQVPPNANSRIYMLDAPGLPNPPATGYMLYARYQNFTTEVEFNHAIASNVYEWHNLTIVAWSGGVWSLAARHAGPGRISIPPSDCLYLPLPE